jgi:hypothetical protein
LDTYYNARIPVENILFYCMLIIRITMIRIIILILDSSDVR